MASSTKSSRKMDSARSRPSTGRLSKQKEKSNSSDSSSNEEEEGDEAKSEKKLSNVEKNSDKSRYNISDEANSDDEDSGFKTINTQQQNQLQDEQDVKTASMSSLAKANNSTSKLSRTRPDSSSSVNSSINGERGITSPKSEDEKSVNYERFQSKDTKSEIENLFN